MKYLVFVETGGEQGNYQEGYSYYTICQGNLPLDILQEWASKNNLKNCQFYQIENGKWTDSGYIIQMVPLYDNCETWQTLRWVEKEQNE
jgi:hypothetical protein